MSLICSQLHQFFNQLPRFVFPYNSQKIPQDGFYVLFERGEKSHGMDRIVHVGSHRGDNRLVLRLNEHFINENKDRSIFRKNIGRALLNKNRDPFLEQWEIDLTTRKSRERYAWQVDLHRQAEIESEVTIIIRSNFSFCVVPIGRRENRKHYVAGLIAAVAQCHQCRPSKSWLGRYSTKQKIRERGLWNVQYLYREPLRYVDFERLKQWVQV